MRSAQPTGLIRTPQVEGLVPHYTMTMSAFRTRLHRDLPPTNVWGFNGSMPGPVIHVRRGQTVLVDWINNLPRRHFLPIDHSIHGAQTDVPDVRNVVHLHGGRVPATSDGYPEDWYTPGHSSLLTYPNQQRAATLWYHDHALGITRLNNLAGLSGIYIIHDEFEQSLNLPSGAFDIPLMISDRTFDANGQLNYPVSGKPGTPHIPEFFGETMLVNGRAMPYLTVEPRKYRFRILNACNARFLRLTLSSGQPFSQIGTDQGLAPAPVAVDGLLLVPSQRSDVIVDFSKQAGKQIVMKNDAPAPYPRGGAVVPPNVMQFRVTTSTTSKDTSAIPSKLLPFAPIDPSTAVKTRDLALIEHRDGLGTPIIDLLEDAHWSAPITEKPVINTVEIWNLVNATDDTHPIHIHLIAFQIIDRRRYADDFFLQEGKVVYSGPPEAPAPEEVGWKDVVRADPEKVTRVIAKFEGYTGRYVWHCHILEHEDNEMMRPFEVLPASSAESGGPVHVTSALALRGKSRREDGVLDTIAPMPRSSLGDTSAARGSATVTMIFQTGYSPALRTAVVTGFLAILALLLIAGLVGCRHARESGSGAIRAAAPGSLPQQCATEEAIGIDPDHNVAYVPVYTLDGGGNAQLAIVDLTVGAANPVIKTISLPGSLIAQSVAYNPNNKSMLATGLASSRVIAYEIDAASQSLKNTVALPGLFALTTNGGIVEDPKGNRALVGTSGFLGVLDTSRSPPLWGAHSIIGLRFNTESMSLNFNTGLAFVTARGSSTLVDTWRSPLGWFDFQVPPNEGMYEGGAFDSATNILVESLENGADLTFAYNFSALDTKVTPASANSVAALGLGFVAPVGDGPGGLAVINCVTHQALLVDKFGQNFKLVQLPSKPVRATDFLNNNGQPGSGTKPDAESAYTIAAAVIPKGVVKGAMVQLGVLSMPPGIAIDPARNLAYMLADASPGNHQRSPNSTTALFLLRIDLSKPVLGAGPSGGIDGKTFWRPASSAIRLP